MPSDALRADDALERDAAAEAAEGEPAEEEEQEEETALAKAERNLNAARLHWSNLQRTARGLLKVHTDMRERGRVGRRARGGRGGGGWWMCVCICLTETLPVCALSLTLYDPHSLC